MCMCVGGPGVCVCVCVCTAGCAVYDLTELEYLQITCPKVGRLDPTYRISSI